jgi:hypothetical protein
MKTKDTSSKKFHNIPSAVFPLSLIALVVIGAIIIGIWYGTRVTDYDVVGSVRGYDIYAGELRDQMRRERAAAIAHFEEKYGAAVDKNFWDTEYDGITPMEYLRNSALESVERYKIQMSLAVDYGLKKKSELSYEAFEKALQAENIDRSNKVAASQPIYGPQVYTKDTYYEYTLSNLIIKLKDSMSVEGEPLYASDKELKKYYDEIKDVAYAKQDTADFHLYELTFRGADNDAAISEDKAYEMMNKVHDILKNADSPEATEQEVKQKYPDVKQRDYQFNDDEASSVYKMSPNAYEQMVSLKAGSFSEPVVDQFTLRILYCETRKSAGYNSFTEYKDSVKSSYNDKYYEIYIDGLCEKTKVKTNDKYNKVVID